MNGQQIVDGILLDSFWALGAVAVAVALAAGLLLVLRPALALKLAARMNREWSIGWLQHALDTPRHTEPFIYRHHRVFGPLLLLGTLYFFWCFATGRYSPAALVALYDGLLPTAVLEILALTFTAVLLFGNGLGFALGLLMLIRPSYLKGTEQLANRWVDTSAAAELLNRKDDRAEGYVHRHPRRIGIIILLATLYIGGMALYTLRL